MKMGMLPLLRSVPLPVLFGHKRLTCTPSPQSTGPSTRKSEQSQFERISNSLDSLGNCSLDARVTRST